ncbi:asparagine synthase (glutamine-hydrolyzing) [Phenylobacterium sp.]|uniref:asparagine synthase (glutamine-hydrolyzing) n=1 Tax=Phenylobacterium sp. TaxID=1871053 RepID=UPI002E315CA1|nr:asparagine synthase (glutamine-hydrolyzing) [Phenylobacterium sp.]HEX3367402.1 asparagine synthase (glutamine-hydrolyzing) [Phenylobacterium sp.]
MCGIAGYVDFSRDAVDQHILSAMTRALARRGPDASGIYTNGPCGLAHTRLSIIDVAGSSQPMALPGGDVTIAYNGELYNYRELRGELEATGELFRTHGDTEVVLRAIGKEWTAALPRFDAMFALAAWDGPRQRLLLARDAVGEKPLFYATPSPGVLVFGSEIKALLEHPLVNRDLDEDALRQALRFRAVYGRDGLSQGVRQLEPGAWLTFDREAGVTTGRFFNLADEVAQVRRGIRGVDDEELIRRGRDLFMDSVRQRLLADVPVGAFLSGGLDSSLIVAAMRGLRAPNEQIQTFSVGFAGDPHSELKYAETVADAFHTQHRPVLVGPDAYISRLAELSACRDGPVSQPADVAIAEMSRLAKESVKVVLSGEGADEIFAGYPKHGFADPPWAIRSALTILQPARAAKIAGMLGLNSRRALVAFRAMAGANEIDRLVQWFSYFDRDGLRDLFPGLGWSDSEMTRSAATQAAALEAVAGEGPLFRMQAVDFATWLPGNMLERGDRMTMAEGLEARMPFLDKELAAFGMALPDRLKIRGGVGKWIVRQWARELLPPEIINRPKWGFRAPLAEWFRGPMRDMLYGYLTDGNGLVGRYGEKDAVLELLRSNDTGEADAGEPLWTLLTAEVWYREVFLARRLAAA